MKAKILLLLSTFMVMTTICLAQRKLGKVSSYDGEANVREYPTSNSRIKGVLYNGNTVYYESCNTKGWYAVYNSNNLFIGYCSSSLIKPYGATSSSSSRKSENLRRGVLNGYDGFVNVRQGPSSKSSIVCSYPNGTSLIFSGSGSWLKAYDINGRYLGYVSSSCVR